MNVANRKLNIQLSHTTQLTSICYLGKMVLQTPPYGSRGGQHSQSFLYLHSLHVTMQLTHPARSSSKGTPNAPPMHPVLTRIPT